jgi:hypothetical protein
LPQAAAPPIRWTQKRTAPRPGDRRTSPFSLSKTEEELATQRWLQPRRAGATLASASLVFSFAALRRKRRDSAAVGCKRCWVADCGVYGLLDSTSKLLAESCAWPPCHRAFSSCPPEQPRHQTFRIRGDGAWRPKRGEEAKLPQAAAPPIKWTQARTAPTRRDRRTSPSSLSKTEEDLATQRWLQPRRAWRGACLLLLTFPIPTDCKRRDRRKVGCKQC